MLDKNNEFNKFGIKKELLMVINEIKYKKPTEIQNKCIPFILKGLDVLGVAKTGSGKSAAFIIPILNNLIINNSVYIRVLVLTPTRELTIQVSNCFNLFSKYLKSVRVLPLYGGKNFFLQLKLLKNKPNIIVATPGRLLDHIRRNNLSLKNVNILVLDEADEMLRMGFLKDVEKIISEISPKRQTILFSATMPFYIKKNIIVRFMKNPVNVVLDNRKNLDINQFYCIINNYKEKIKILTKFLEVEEFKSVIIFVKTKDFTLKLSSILEKKNYFSSALNGDMDQNLREKIIGKFRSGFINILVATDLASRGLDIENVDFIINYDVPCDIDTYIHRIGRTGRAGKIGKSLILISSRDRRFLFNINKKLFNNIKKVYIPNKNKIFNSRLVKLGNLIKNNLVNKNYLNFYNNIIDNISSNYKLNNNDIILSLVKIIYMKYF